MPADDKNDTSLPASDRKAAPSNSQSLPASQMQEIGTPLAIRQTSLPCGLYLVATPIGNLRDITLRALDVLASADRIYAEDTRQSAKLLKAYQLTARLTAYHDHNVAKRIPDILSALDDGQSVALISDAGTPLVSDPGYKLARAAALAGHDIIPLPGASAALAGLLTSALPSDKFLFAGFLPPKSAARKTALTELLEVKASLIFFESPSRVGKALADMKTVFGNRQAALARELTKTFEETRRGALSDLIDSVAADPPRGEIVLIIGGAQGKAEWSETELKNALLPLIKTDGVKRAAKAIASQSGLPQRDVYDIAQRLKDAQKS